MIDYQPNLIKSIFFIILVVAALPVAACMPVTARRQAALPTPTPVPTFTPTPITTIAPSPMATAVTQASLSGRILDQNNAPIAEARVRVGAATGITDTDGSYTLTGLTPGQYVLSVTHPDYDPGLSSILTVAAGQPPAVDLSLYAPNTSPYPDDPMLTNPLDPNGAPTPQDAERLARLQGMTGQVVNIRQTHLSGEFLVNYKIGDDIRAAVAEIDHEVWELTDDTGQKWWIIQVCGNLASLLPGQEMPIPTPMPRPLLPMAEVAVDSLVVRTCAAENCTEVGTLTSGEQVEVFGCLAGGDWCEVGWSGGRGWCMGLSLQHLAVATVVPVVEAILPTPTSGDEVGEIAFVFKRDGIDEIYTINADGSDFARLTTNSVNDGCPAWSPDGQRIAFCSDRDGNYEIYVMDADGSNQIQLTNDPAHDTSPTWSPNGQQIAFSSNDKIHVMNADGSGLTRLPDRPDASDREPAWSPDGQWIAFSSWTEVGGSGKASIYMIPEIFLINPDGSDLVSLQAAGVAPAWSPDGQRIVFSHLLSLIFSADLEWGIDVMNVDSGGFTSLTVEGASPSWSPDGQQIAFSKAVSGPISEIWLMNTDGTNQRKLTDGSQPTWRPIRRQ